MQNSRLKNSLLLNISVLLITAFFIYLIPNQLYARLKFFLGNGYFYPVYISLIIAAVWLIIKAARNIKAGDNLMKWVYGLIFLPAIFFPLMRCYFKVPYIFCRACPRLCPFGYLRPVIIPSFLLLNLDKRAWCYKMCPVGTLHDYQSNVCKKRACLPGWLSNIRYLFLAFSVIVTIGLIVSKTFLGWFFKESHHFYIWTFAVMVAMFLIAFLIPRFWCNYFCPIGSTGDLVLAAKSRFLSKEKTALKGLSANKKTK